MEQVKKEGAKRLTDPDGRETLSFINAGKFGEGLTPEQVEKLAPFLVISLTLLRNPTGVCLAHSKQKTAWKMLSAVKLRLWTLISRLAQNHICVGHRVHELGHPIEAKSNLRSFLTQLSYLKGHQTQRWTPCLKRNDPHGFKRPLKQVRRVVLSHGKD